MLAKILNFIDSSSEWIGKTFSWMCLLMIGVLIFEVTARYIFNSPTEWAHESTTMLYGTFCMVGAIWTLQRREHVRTEVVYQVLPLKVQLFLDVLTGIIAMIMLGIFFYASFLFAMESWQTKEISSKSTWGVIIYPFKTVVPVVGALMFIQQLANTIRDLSRLFGCPIEPPHKLQDETKQ